MPAAKGPEAITAAAKPFTTAFPDVTGSPQLILVNGNQLASIYVLKGTHTGPLQGPGQKPLPATNKPIGTYFGHAIEMDPAANSVIREWQFNENGALMAQLGVSKAPARPATTTAPASPTIVMASGSETEAKNVAAFRSQLELFNAHNLAGVAAFNATDAVFHDLTQPKDTDSKGNEASLGEFMKAFPDARLTATSVWGAGEWVAARGVFEGTNKGTSPSMGIKTPTGKSVQVHYLEFTRFENGKIKEDWLIFDTMAFAGQLGLLGS